MRTKILTKRIKSIVRQHQQAKEITENITNDSIEEARDNGSSIDEKKRAIKDKISNLIKQSINPQTVDEKVLEFTNLESATDDIDFDEDSTIIKLRFEN